MSQYPEPEWTNWSEEKTHEAAEYYLLIKLCDELIHGERSRFGIHVSEIEAVEEYLVSKGFPRDAILFDPDTPEDCDVLIHPDWDWLL